MPDARVGAAVVTTLVLSALAYRAAMPLVLVDDLPRLVAEHTRLIERMTSAELHAYHRQAQGLTRVEADDATVQP